MQQLTEIFKIIFMKIFKTLLVATIMPLFLSSCYKNVIGDQFAFVRSELIVEVDKSTKSFPIELVLIYDDDSNIESNKVLFDQENSTAKDKTHFVNELDVALLKSDSSPIAKFKLREDGKTYYKDVTLIPENITEEVVIYYQLQSLQIDENDRLKVILKPKK